MSDTLGKIEGHVAVEVGPGPGGITRAILDARVKECHVIEKDPRFLPSLKLIKESVGPERLHISIGDCLHYNVSSKLIKFIFVFKVTQFESFCFCVCHGFLLTTRVSAASMCLWGKMVEPLWLSVSARHTHCLPKQPYYNPATHFGLKCSFVQYSEVFTKSAFFCNF